MKKIQCKILLALAFITSNVVAADLVTFNAGETISSNDINQNFSALNDELPVTGSNYLIIGDTQIVYGAQAIPAATGAAPPTPSFTSVSFSKAFASKPVVTLGIVGVQLFPPDVSNITNSGFNVSNSGNAMTLNYVAIGKI